MSKTSNAPDTGYRTRYGLPRPITSGGPFVTARVFSLIPTVILARSVRFTLFPGRSTTAASELQRILITGQLI